MSTTEIVQKLWNYCNVLRDDGMSYGDHIEAAPAYPCARGIRTSLFSTVAYFLFLKMVVEHTREQRNRKTVLPSIHCRQSIKIGQIEKSRGLLG